MPSSHSQFMFFVSGYLVLFIMFRLSHTKLGKFTWFLTTVACLGLSATVGYGRVYLGYHTGPQVYWGSGIGIGFAIIWFLMTQFILSPVYSWLCSTRLFEFFLIRDYSDIPNVIWFDYWHAKDEGKKRKNRKKSLKNKQK